MKRFVVGLALAACLGSPAFAISPQTVEIGGQTATRIVIAPPETDLARTIKLGLKQAMSEAGGGATFNDALKLYYFYGARHFEPLWLDQRHDGDIAWSMNAQKIMEAFYKAGYSGLDPDDYLDPAFQTAPDAGDPMKLAALETMFSDAALRYASHLHSGRIDPKSVSSSISAAPHQLDATETLMALAATDDPAAYFQSVEPQHREYQDLKRILIDYTAGRVEQAVSIPDGPMLRPGGSDERLPLLRQRLKLPAIEDDPFAYDDATLAAVEAFQQSLDLLVDGIVGPATVAALNGGEATSRGDIVANMERWRWMPSDLGAYHVSVNIPEFRLAIVDDGAVTFTTRVVTGKPVHMTPVFSDEIETVVVNPYWNVPSSIAVNEIGPILANNPGYIANNNMELLSGGKVVDASAVDWSATSVRNFSIRQRPGASNALGSIKFLFPNSNNVYLHDTPSKSLFERSFRAYSHGCVRVQNPWDFADALLSHETKVTLAGLESQRGGRETWNSLDRHIPVHLMYFTLRADADGTIHSYGDVYGHNQKLKELLGV
ncbi:MAG: L,D-transpeptidase family protein [Alphaproteobacteria bacterium]|nr:L,D-transpeptidase family protein [Alphaproteobacteria bacterium]